MSVTCGFFESKNHDRRYFARDMSAIFDGLIIDGVFSTIGDALIVKANKGNTVNMGSGKAWFDHTWTINDSVLPIELPETEVLLDRIDAIVLETNNNDDVRNNEFKVIKGAPSSEPKRPVMVHDNALNQHAICYIRRHAGISEIHQEDITNAVGTAETPFVVAMLETISVDQLLGQWQNQLDRFIETETNDFTTWKDTQTQEFTAWRTEQTNIYVNWFNDNKASLLREQQLLDEWIKTEQEDFLKWYNSIKDQLGNDPAGKLLLRIDTEALRRILLVGFVDGTKVFSDDGTVITATSSDKRTLVKTFTDNFNVITSVLRSETGHELAQMVKKFSPDGKTITTQVTYY